MAAVQQGTAPGSSAASGASMTTSATSPGMLTASGTPTTFPAPAKALESASSSTPSPFASMNILVTGCASPVGREICRALAARGANLALTDSDKAEAQELCLELQRDGHQGSLLLAAMDPTDSDRLTSFVKSVSKTLIGLHGVVNCAFFAPEENLVHSMRPAVVAQILDSNYKPVWTTVHAAINQFESQSHLKLAHPKGGYSIVNVTSSFDGNEYSAAYQSAQHAILGLTQSCAVQYAHSDIRINMVSAGPVEDPSPSVSLMNTIFSSISLVKEKIPMRRLARASEVAQAVLFLLGPESSYITGANIPVDGGIQAKRA